MKEKEEEVPNLTVPQLVVIGDAIHNSKTAIIIADNEDDKGHTTTVCVRGTKQNLIIMLYEVFKSNKDFEEVCATALINFKMDAISDSFSKKQ